MSIIDTLPITDINGETYEDHVRKKANDQGIIKLTGQTIQDAINNPAQRAAWKKNATRVKQQYLASKLQGDNRVNNISAGVLNAFAEVPAFFGSLLPNDFMPGEGELFKDVFTFQNIYNKLKTDYK